MRLPCLVKVFNLSGRHFELVVVKLQRRRRDVNAEKCRRISVMNPDRRIQRQHIRRHPRPVAPRLYFKTLEHNTLDDDLRLISLAGAPQDQRERREEYNEQQREAEVQPDAAAGASFPESGAIFVVVVVGFFDLLAALQLPPGGEAAGVLKRGGEAGRGGLARVVDGRAVVEVVRRRPGRARAVRHLLHVVV